MLIPTGQRAVAKVLRQIIAKPTLFTCSLTLLLQLVLGLQRIFNFDLFYSLTESTGKDSLDHQVLPQI